MSLSTSLPQRILFLALGLSAWTMAGNAQTGAYERTFSQSKPAIEKALASLQPGMAGHLPVLDGFATSADHPLDRYQRAYFQSSVQVSAIPGGGSLVRVTTKVTAWYVDPAGAHSGYQLLTSNGRIESDLLDQLSDLVAKTSPAVAAHPEPATAPAHAPTAQPINPQPPVAQAPVSSEPAGSEPAVPPTDAQKNLAQSANASLADQMRAAAHDATSPAEKSHSALEAEAANLQELLRNMAHPKNLVAVKKSGTPVVSTPSLTAKPQFLASLHDEFEMLDFNADWVHVRISGLSRGWIWRNSVEMPEGIAENEVRAAAPQPAAADLFHVSREESSTFPGDWEPLKNKNVKIISVQKADENAKDAGPQQRLEYAKFLLDKGYAEIAQQTQALAGIVVIFDSADGGMIAATTPALQQWKAGKLSDSALWHQCYFDPPETFDFTAPSGGQ